MIARVIHKEVTERIPVEYTHYYCPKCGNMAFLDVLWDFVCPYCAADNGDKVKMMVYDALEENDEYKFTGCGWERRYKD